VRHPVGQGSLQEGQLAAGPAGEGAGAQRRSPALLIAPPIPPRYLLPMMCHQMMHHSPLTAKRPLSSCPCGTHTSWPGVSSSTRPLLLLYLPHSCRERGRVCLSSPLASARPSTAAEQQRQGRVAGAAGERARGSNCRFCNQVWRRRGMQEELQKLRKHAKRRHKRCAAAVTFRKLASAERRLTQQRAPSPVSPAGRTPSMVPQMPGTSGRASGMLDLTAAHHFHHGRLALSRHSMQTYPARVRAGLAAGPPADRHRRLAARATS